ncbi:uncharacterized protein A4U43_C03F31440 [Asparagus officinalis]|uniref:Uncharacterized protein n=1 Tax=Asparagus officinalis TaxID=4686 RepID=A0A5P1FF35_ASPOF|nr:uncharacterized protein A4U43_C03F31440 [Asparagus officinalis]
MPSTHPPMVSSPVREQHWVLVLIAKAPRTFDGGDDASYRRWGMSEAQRVQLRLSDGRPVNIRYHEMARTVLCSEQQMWCYQGFYKILQRHELLLLHIVDTTPSGDVKMKVKLKPKYRGVLKADMSTLAWVAKYPMHNDKSLIAVGDPCVGPNGSGYKATCLQVLNGPCRTNGIWT